MDITYPPISDMKIDRKLELMKNENEPVGQISQRNLSTVCILTPNYESVKANINMVTDVDDIKFALRICIETNNDTLVSLFAEYHQDKYKTDPFVWRKAAAQQNPKILLLFLRTPEILQNKPTNNGSRQVPFQTWHPLAVAARDGHVQNVANILNYLENSESGKNEFEFLKAVAVEAAAIHGHDQVIDLFIDNPTFLVSSFKKLIESGNIEQASKYVYNRALNFVSDSISNNDLLNICAVHPSLLRKIIRRKDVQEALVSLPDFYKLVDKVTMEEWKVQSQKFKSSFMKNSKEYRNMANKFKEIRSNYESNFSTDQIANMMKNDTGKFSVNLANALKENHFDKYEVDV